MLAIGEHSPAQRTINETALTVRMANALLAGKTLEDAVAQAMK